MVKKKEPGRTSQPVEESPQALEVLLHLIKGEERATDIAKKLKKNQSVVFRLLERLEKAKYVKKKNAIYSINETTLIDYFANAGIDKTILQDHFHVWFEEFALFGKTFGATKHNPALKDIVLYFKINQKLMKKFNIKLPALFK